MSYQWTLIAGVLYLEIAVVIILTVPIISSKRWSTIFKSSIFSTFQRRAGMYFYVILGVFIIFLVDSVREMRKYSHAVTPGTVIAKEMKSSVKLFRAQRNFYITGFSIFLALILRRLITMIVKQSELFERNEEIQREVEMSKKVAQDALIQQALDAIEKEEREATILKLKTQLELAKETNARLSVNKNQ